MLQRLHKTHDDLSKGLFDALFDFLDSPHAVDLFDLAGACVIADQRGGLFVVDAESFADGGFVVVAAAFDLSAFEESLDNSFFVDFEEHDRIKGGAEFLKELIEGLGLGGGKIGRASCRERV